jgi:hypothetical protein
VIGEKPDTPWHKSKDGPPPAEAFERVPFEVTAEEQKLEPDPSDPMGPDIMLTEPVPASWGAVTLDTGTQISVSSADVYSNSHVYHGRILNGVAHNSFIMPIVPTHLETPRMHRHRTFTRHLGFLTLLLVLAPFVRAEKVTLVVGGSGPDGGPANQAQTTKPFGLAFDRKGNLYIGEFGGQRVRKVDTHGIISTIAGTGKIGSSGDGGPATQAEFNFIHDIVIGPDDNLYVADSFNHKIRKIDLTTGTITLFAGAGEGKKSTGDGGPAKNAALDGVASLWFSADGSVLYLSGFSKSVRTINMNSGIINTIKGLSGGRSIALDSKGNLYVAGGQTLSVRTPDGAVKVLLDKTHTGGSNEPLGSNPKHLGIDANDHVLICDEEHHKLRDYIPAEDKLVTIMGTGKPGTQGLDGPLEKAQLNRPHGVLFHDGVVYLCDSMNDRVLRIEP